MANQIKTDFLFLLDDKQMVAALGRVNDRLSGFNQGLDSLGGKAIILNQTIELLTKAGDAAQSVFETARQGAASEGVFTAFGAQMRKFGMTAESGLEQFSRSVSGTVDKVSLLSSANKALLSGLDPEVIATTMEYVSKYSRTQQSGGRTPGELLNTVITGVTRGSTEFLDDVGIIVSQTQVVNEKTKEWGRSLTDLEKKQVVVAEAMKQMSEKMSDFDDLADNQSEKIERLVAKLRNWRNELAAFTADVVVPAGIDPKRSASMFGSLDAELTYYKKLLDAQKKAGAAGDAVAKTQNRIAEIQSQQEIEKRERAHVLLSGGSVASAEKFRKDLKDNADSLATVELESSTAGLTAYQKELKKINDTYAAMPKYTPELKKQADEYLRIAKSNLSKDQAVKNDKKAFQSAERLQREIDRKAERLTEETEKNKTEIKIAELSDYGSEALAIENKFRAEDLKAQRELVDDMYDAEKLGSAKLEQLAQTKFDSRISLISAQRDAERRAFAEKQAEAEQEIVWQSMLAEMDLADQQKQSASSLRKQTWENRQSFQDRFSDEYTQKDNALKRDMWSKFTETNDWDAAEMWYRQEKAALDYAASIGTVSKNLSDFSNITNQDVKGAFESLEAPMSTFIKSMGEGKFQFSELISGIEDQLKIYAAGKTAHFLMEAAYSGYMGLIKSMNPLTAWESPLWYNQASQYLSSAAVMGSFVTGMGLAGMAHDGIDYIPKTGTWLIEEGERITDKRTNADLKAFLANPTMGGGVSVSLGGITINGGDEQGVLKAIPQFEKAVTDIVIKAVSGGNASLRNAISTYAR
ncbi:hypothetical protein [Seleniivibrio woodruffii]|uniref:hypothetical protein n=1 Tax=Seleniivibrio woodruffii TaxID=1078050 RepID=UPI002409F4DB|nr:hypothetical protein [Seleniivibrio woodruffii]